jgi:P4 family phage/plasmid primase-like protien
LLAAYPLAHVAVVEGERTCDAARDQFNAAGFMQEHLIAMTWSGGTAGVGHTDFESLRGRKVALLPDADEPGLKAMRELAQKLLGIAAEVKLVLPPPGVPIGWDLADELPIGFDLRAYAKSAVLVANSAVAVAVAEPAHAGARDETSQIAETTTVVEPQQVGHPTDSVSIQSTLRALLPVELPFLADVRDGVGGRFALTELGNAWRILDKHGGDLCYLPEINHWLTWEGGAWRPDRDGGRVRGLIAMLFRDLLEEASTTVLSNDCEHVIKWSRKSQEARVIQNVANLVKDSLRIRVPLAHVDGDPLLAGLDGGRQVIDLRSGQVRPAAREDYITRSLGINNVGDAAKAVRWLKFMDDIFLGDAELINWFKRFLGYCLTGLYSEQIFLFLHGGGSNGKGVLMKVLKLLFGGYFGTVATSTLMEQKRQGGGASPDIVGMAGYRLLMASETSSGSVFDEQFLKNWTGGDPQKARALYAKDELTFEPVGKLAIAGNHRPRISGTDYAIWRRLRLIPFRRTFKGHEKDEKLHERLGDELPDICAWIIEGCLEWQQRGLADTPSVVKAAGRDYAEEQDTLGEFLEENVEQCPGAECASREIFPLYIAWAIRCNLKSVSRQAFGRQIAERGFTIKRDRYGSVYVGMSLKLPV